MATFPSKEKFCKIYREIMLEKFPDDTYFAWKSCEIAEKVLPDQKLQHFGFAAMYVQQEFEKNICETNSSITCTLTKMSKEMDIKKVKYTLKEMKK